MYCVNKYTYVYNTVQFCHVLCNICNRYLFIAFVALILFLTLIFFYKQDATGNFAIEWIST